MGSKTKTITGAVIGAATGGVGALVGAYVGSQIDARDAKKDAIKAQERKQQALIEEQRQAEVQAKERVVASRKAMFENETVTNYSNSLLGTDETPTKKKKTVLGG